MADGTGYLRLVAKPKNTPSPPKRRRPPWSPPQDMRVASFYEKKTELYSLIDALDPSKIWTAPDALDACLDRVKLALAGISHDSMNLIEPPPNAWLATRAVWIAEELLSAGVDAVRDTMDERTRRALIDSTRKTLFGRNFLTEARVMLCTPLLGAAQIWRRAQESKDPWPSNERKKTGALSDFAEVFIAASWKHSLNGIPPANWPWGDMVLSEVAVTYPEARERLNDRDIAAALDKLSRRPGPREPGKWEVLARLVKKAGLGTVTGPALRAELSDRQTKDWSKKP